MSGIDFNELEFFDAIDEACETPLNLPHYPTPDESGSGCDDTLSSPISSPMSSQSSMQLSLNNDDEKRFEDFHYCVSWSIHLLRHLQPIGKVMTQDDLISCEKNNPKRRRVGSKKWKYFEIFPWVLQYIKLQKPTSLRETIEDLEVAQILQAMNYFWHRRLSELELVQLKEIFLRLGEDDTKHLLSRIPEIYRFMTAKGGLSTTQSPPLTLEFNEDWDGLNVGMGLDDDYLSFAHSSSSSSQPNNSCLGNEGSGISGSFSPQHHLRQDERLDDLERRVEKLEQSKESEKPTDTSSIPGSKRFRAEPAGAGPASGGDRARWLQIREADYPSREKWCTPGSVFGMYPDGVGPLQARRTYTQILVYSTAPDTLEEHPDPLRPDHYVRVVMIGEAPVRLRPKQIEKLKRLDCFCHLYVNQEGEVNVRAMATDKSPPTGGMIFGTTRWNEAAPRDPVDGYPMFQGVRGVCVVIESMSQTASTQFDTALHRAHQSLSGAMKALSLKR